MDLSEKIRGIQYRVMNIASSHNVPGKQDYPWSTESCKYGTRGELNGETSTDLVEQDFATDDERKAAFAHMGGSMGGSKTGIGSSIGAPVGVGPGGTPRGTVAGRYVDSGGINAKGQAAKTVGIHAPTNRRPGRGAGGLHGPKVARVPFRTQVANKLGLSPKQLAAVMHAVKGKSPSRLAAGAKLHTKLAKNAASTGQKHLAAQHKQAAAIHRSALKAFHAQKKAAALAKRDAHRSKAQASATHRRVMNMVRGSKLRAHMGAHSSTHAHVAGPKSFTPKAHVSHVSTPNLALRHASGKSAGVHAKGRSSGSHVASRSTGAHTTHGSGRSLSAHMAHAKAHFRKH